MSDKFRKFMNPYGLGSKLVTGIVLLMLGYFLGIMVREKLFSPIPLLVSGVCLWMSLKPFFAGRAFFRSLEGKNINAIETDFQRGYPFVRGKVRLGENYIFAKGSGQLVAYGDIGQIYLHIHRIGGMEDKRMLNFVDASGRHFPLCPLQRKGKSDDEMRDILAVIRRKNPDVKISF